MSKLTTSTGMEITINGNAMTNAEIWNEARALSPQFQSLTAPATADYFNERTFERLKNTSRDILDSYFGLSLQIWLAAIEVARTIDPLEDAGVTSVIDVAHGGLLQKISIDSITPIAPGWLDLQDGKPGPDPFVVRKGTQAQRFFRFNFNYASMITVPDDFKYKQMFINENGMSQFMAGVFEGLQAGYTNQKYLNKLEAINAAINSTTDPLQDTQRVKVSLTKGDPTAEELTALCAAIEDVRDHLAYTPQTAAFNALGFSTHVEPSRLKLLIRFGVKNAIRYKVLTSALTGFNGLSLPVDFVEVDNFGGLIPYQSVENNVGTTRLYPVVDDLGAVIGFSETEKQKGPESVTVKKGQEKYVDPNANVVAVLLDTDTIFEGHQNPYMVEPQRNARGRYTNYFASSPENGIWYDAMHTLITFETPAEAV